MANNHWNNSYTNAMHFVLFDSKTLEIEGKASSDKSLIDSLVPGLQIGVVEDHRIRHSEKNNDPKMLVKNFSSLYVDSMMNV